MTKVQRREKFRNETAAEMNSALEKGRFTIAHGTARFSSSNYLRIDPAGILLVEEGPRGYCRTVEFSEFTTGAIAALHRVRHTLIGR